jgi:hypothetical protein
METEACQIWFNRMMTNAGPVRGRERLKRFLEKRFSLRLHMFMILTGTFFAGMLASKLLLTMHVYNMLIRYPAAVVCSYLAFFGFVKLWLVYLSSSAGSRGPANSVSNSKDSKSSGWNITDLPIDLPSSGGSSFSSGGSFSAGGGSFGGGGASASFDTMAEAPAQVMAAAPSDAGGSVVSGVADGVGDAVSGIFDDDGMVLIILGILLALFFGAGVYLIVQAPVILSEAAFQAILSTSLLRSMKKMSHPDWIGGVLRTTIVPFAGVMIISVAAAWVIHSAYPGTTKMTEVIRHFYLKWLN